MIIKLVFNIYYKFMKIFFNDNIKNGEQPNHDIFVKAVFSNNGLLFFLCFAF